MDRLKETLTYQFLELESEIHEVPENVYNKLYKIVSDFQFLYEKKFSSSFENNKEQALELLQLIEEVLQQNNLISITPKPVQFLSDGLIPKKLTNEELGDFSFWLINKKRNSYIQKHRNNNFYKMDCDLYCFLYYCLAELCGFPLTIAEMDQHNYIKWILPQKDDKYINWEANEGTVRKKWLPDAHHVMTRDEIKGYFYLIRGIAWMREKKFERAIEDYKLSDHIYKNYHKAKCNLAWVYISEINTLTDDFREKALNLARDAVNLDNHDLSLHVYACALAENEDFVSAIKILEKAIKKAPHVRRNEYVNLLEAFKKGITYKQALCRKKNELINI